MSSKFVHIPDWREWTSSMVVSRNVDTMHDQDLVLEIEFLALAFSSCSIFSVESSYGFQGQKTITLQQHIEHLHLCCALFFDDSSTNVHTPQRSTSSPYTVKASISVFYDCYVMVK